MRMIALVLCTLCVAKVQAEDKSFLPFQNPKHTKRYYTDIAHPPMMCYTAHPHFRFFYFDDYNDLQVVYKVKCIRIDKMGVYFVKSDIISKVRMGDGGKKQDL